MPSAVRTSSRRRPAQVAGVLRGAAYAAYRRGSASQSPQTGTVPGDSNVNFTVVALRETGDLVSAAIGDERRQELRIEGAAMSMDEAVAYALANIDPNR
jgi:hypothetical protein